MSKNQYVNTLPQKAQNAIWQYLYDCDIEELTTNDINNAMNSRISDLEEIISYEEILELVEKVGK